MYTNTAYAALYQMMGLQFQEAVIHWITHEAVFKGVILLLFGASFMIFLIHFVSRHLPFVITVRRAPLSRLILLIFCLFLGISLLKAKSNFTSHAMDHRPWSQNPYVQKRSRAAQTYRVSFLFKLLAGSAEEVARHLGLLIDRTFSPGASQMHHPNFFFKAMLGAASSTIEDPELRDLINFYTAECLSQVLPQVHSGGGQSFLDRFFSHQPSEADQQLLRIKLQLSGYPNCWVLKKKMNFKLQHYAKSYVAQMGKASQVLMSLGHLNHGFGETYQNWVASSLLVNHYLGEHEGTLGLEKGTELPGAGGRIVQFINRAFSVEGAMSFFGARELKGVSLAAQRSQEFSDHLARAPHVAGFLQMLLVGFFPFLVFFLAAGKWKPLGWWWLTYFSICLWTPIWNLLYHVMTTLTLSMEMMQTFGEQGDGVSLYGAQLVSSRMYQAFAVYSYLQLLIGPLFTGFLLRCMTPVLNDSAADFVPGGVVTASRVSSKVGLFQ